MKIGISLLELTPGRIGGSEVYARSLCRALGAVGENDYRVLVTPPAEDAGAPLPTTVVGAYPAGRSVVTRARAAAAQRWSRRLREEAGLGALDGVHYPLTAMVPPPGSTPTVVTAHDVQHLVLPRNFTRAQLLYRRHAYEGGMQRARAVIAISDHVRETLLERVGLQPEHVATVHSGVDHERFSPPPPDAAREPFLLYPAFPWPHKDHATLLAAFALLRRRRPELRLVLTGAPAEALPAGEGVERRGFVAADELVRLYRTAAALVFPSRYEGFGQPLLEAMACGCPVVAAGATAIPETCGGAALLVAPGSAEALAAAVDEVLDDPGPWAARGLARASAFSWEATARATDAVYARLSGV